MKKRDKNRPKVEKNVKKYGKDRLKIKKNDGKVAKNCPKLTFSRQNLKNCSQEACQKEWQNKAKLQNNDKKLIEIMYRHLIFKEVESFFELK